LAGIEAISFVCGSKMSIGCTRFCSATARKFCGAPWKKEEGLKQQIFGAFYVEKSLEPRLSFPEVLQ
jgi:hypothetical protein